MRKFFLLIVIFPLFCSSQEYVDLFKIGYGRTYTNEFKNVDGNTNIKSFQAGLTLPLPVSKNQVFITGADFSYNKLQLFPEAEFTSLYSTTLKIGMASNWSEKWSTNFILLPKLASDYRNISQADFYIGGIALLKLKKSDDFLYRFGFYASQEAFGLFTTPVFGWYYLSSNQKFEMDMSLPISANVNYKLGTVTVGLDYLGISRSFNVNSENIYADLNSLEIATYLQFNIIKSSVLLRTKLGYSSNHYQVYAKGDKMDLGISAFSIGDDRNQLNPSINGSTFGKIEMIYRFHTTKSGPESSLK